MLANTALDWVEVMSNVVAESSGKMRELEIAMIDANSPDD